uniref:NgoMIV restriction enzyme n=1 Tax=Candidatus Kentrum sp. FM TaxID=2126340 RepID=A0A450TNL1_9GAMM|nr:MAG: NgoMIV restriction enzyme [Candidatus Kentron sp. FM]VFJ69386.1 MAG: NgoMIV restriction enzyme [Candidatus Kentron sp. FM]VFK16911.1 MAG: NgoMIV restriction enzyme [Candidatus Kentron sp. FM]
MFETLTREFIASAFAAIVHLRPGKWAYRTERTTISNFVQYQHLSTLVSLVKTDPHLAAALGQGYIVTPDIVVVRQPVTEDEINHHEQSIESGEPIARLTQFRATNQSESPARSFLHASISCKWTIRSDRSQNTRTEALNLIRNRKGALPHIVAVTAEPLPMRIASLALGTGDLDCVYHFALPELRVACAAADRGEDQLEMLDTMIYGNRLRDISDLPFDLAV